MRYVAKRDRLAFYVSLVLALAGLFAAFLGQMPWWPGLFFAVCAAALVLGSDLPRHIDEIEITARSIRRTRGRRLWVKKVEAISWDGLSKVEMVADDSDDCEGVCFLLHGPSGAPMAVSDGRPEIEHLLFEMQRRLPGFDECLVENAYEAWRRTKDGRVLIWQRPAPGPVS
jgi:hypothetical protein